MTEFSDTGQPSQRVLAVPVIVHSVEHSANCVVELVQAGVKVELGAGKVSKRAAFCGRGAGGPILAELALRGRPYERDLRMRRRHQESARQQKARAAGLPYREGSLVGSFVPYSKGGGEAILVGVRTWQLWKASWATNGLQNAMTSSDARTSAGSESRRPPHPPVSS